MRRTVNSPMPWESEQEGGKAQEQPYELFAGYPDLMTVSDVCEVTGLSAQTIRARLNQGELPGFRIGHTWYVSKPAFVAFVERRQG